MRSSRILSSLRHLKAAFTIVVFGIIGVVVIRTYFQYRRAKAQKIAIRASLRESVSTDKSV